MARGDGESPMIGHKIEFAGLLADVLKGKRGLNSYMDEMAGHKWRAHRGRY